MPREDDPRVDIKQKPEDDYEIPGMESEPGDLTPTQSPTTGASDNERIWAALVHASYFFLSIIGPLLVIVLDKEIFEGGSEYVRAQARQALFWQLATLGLSIVTCGIAWLVMAVWAILATLAANRGEMYRYPMVGDYAAES